MSVSGVRVSLMINTATRTDADAAATWWAVFPSRPVPSETAPGETGPSGPEAAEGVPDLVSSVAADSSAADLVRGKAVGGRLESGIAHTILPAPAIRTGTGLRLVQCFCLDEGQAVNLLGGRLPCTSIPPGQSRCDRISFLPPPDWGGCPELPIF